MERAIMTAVYSFVMLLVTTSIMVLVDPANVSDKIVLFMEIIWFTAAILFAFSLLIMIYITRVLYRTQAATLT